MLEHDFSFNVETYTHDDNNEIKEITYTVRGTFYPYVAPDLKADNDIEYHGQAERLEYEVEDIVNLTDNTEIKEKWIHDSDVYDDCFEHVMKEFPEYFEEL